MKKKKFMKIVDIKSWNISRLLYRVDSVQASQDVKDLRLRLLQNWKAIEKSHKLSNAKPKNQSPFNK